MSWLACFLLFAEHCGVPPPLTRNSKKATNSSIKHASFIENQRFSNYADGGTALNKLLFFSSPIRKNELKRKEVLLLGCRYISASSTASSHQSTKYLFDFDLRLFPQHRYTYCYNTFLFHQIQQIKRFIEFTERKKKFILFLFDWRELMNCWFVIAAPFIEEINFFKLRGGWL